MPGNLSNRITRILPRLAEVIAGEQDMGGGFSSLSSASPDFNNTAKYRTLFFPALVAACIAGSDQLLLQPVKRKLVDFLLSQKSAHWSFNYWDRASPEFVKLPYPDDLDDTFCALGALANLEPGLVGGEALAGAVSLLTAVEVDPGGPYRTWIVGPEAPAAWRDVDFAVNCNVAWFLRGQGVALPGLTLFLEDHIRRLAFRSRYYPSIFPSLYYLSRAYSGPFVRQAAKFLRGQRTGVGWGNGLDTALAVTSLLGFGENPETLEEPMGMLLELCESGGLLPQPFCYDPMIEGNRYVAGATALTAAMSLEALELYRKESSSARSPKISFTGFAPANQIYGTAQAIVRRRFAELGGELKDGAELILSRLLKQDAADRQIILLPYSFAAACGAEATLGEDFLARLGAANLYGWIAYTIYDNIADEQRDVQLLPVANVCLRQVIELYVALVPGFGGIFGGIMDRMELANVWELRYARTGNINQPPDYGDYGALAGKSLGHILGPLAIVYRLGFDEASPQIKATEKMFYHYLIARQLNDDAHDWQDDLRAGHTNSVAALVLRRWLKAQPAELTAVPADLESILPELQKLFWQETIREVCFLIRSHAGQARRHANGLEILKNAAFLEDMLAPLEQAAAKAERESAKAADFLRSYNPL